MKLVATPKTRRPLPRALAPAAAREVIEDIGEMSDHATTQARDTALFTLLYGCGLRIAEALSLNVRDAPRPGDDGPLHVVGKGSKERIVPVLPVVREAIAAWLRLHPTPRPDAPLFLGARGNGWTRRSRSGHCDCTGVRTACRNTRRHMRCGTRSPRICWRAVRICGRSRTCSDMRVCRPRNVTPTSMRPACWRFGARRIRGRDACIQAQGIQPGRKKPISR